MIADDRSSNPLLNGAFISAEDGRSQYDNPPRSNPLLIGAFISTYTGTPAGCSTWDTYKSSNPLLIGAFISTGQPVYTPDELGEVAIPY